MPLAIGSKLGPYEIVAPIGAGERATCPGFNGSSETWSSKYPALKINRL